MREMFVSYKVHDRWTASGSPKKIRGVLLLFMIASIVACGYFVAQMGMVVLRVFGLLYACLKGCAHC